MPDSNNKTRERVGQKVMKKQEGFFGVHFDFHAVATDTLLGADADAGNIAHFLDRVRPDFVTWDCKGHPGQASYPTKVGTASPGIVRDALAIWREETRARGVLLGVHYSGVIDEAAIAAHPEYARVTPEGTPDNRVTSVFGRYADEYMLPQLKEIVDTYAVDYVWLDGECWGAQLDYCDRALALWKEETGLDAAPRSPQEEHWQQWKAFNRRYFERYLQHWTSTLQAYAPQVCTISNWAFSTMMPVAVNAPLPMISGDFDPNVSLDRARTECRYLQNTGKPWELLSWGFDIKANYSEQFKPAVQVMQEAAAVLSHGGAFMIYYQPTRSGYVDDTITDTSAEVAAFCRKREALCHGSRPVKQVAVLYSADTQLDKSNNVYTWWDSPLREVEGMLHALLELHYSCDVVAEHQLLPCLKEYPYVVIPDGYAIRPEVRDELLNYVREGGSLLIADGATALLFADALGVEMQPEPQPDRTVIAVDGHKLSSRAPWYRVKTVTAQTLYERCVSPSLQGALFGTDVRKSGVSAEMAAAVERYPAVTLNRFGKGLIAGFYDALPGQYYENHHPYTRELVGEVSRRLFPAPAVQLDGPPTVDVSLRIGSDGHRQVHLLNTTCMTVSERRPYCDFFPPLYALRVRVACEQKPARILWQPDGEELEFDWSDGMASVTVPRLELHGVVEIIG